MSGFPTGVKVVRRDPGRDARTIATVEAAVRRGDIGQAVAMAREALGGGLIHPLLLNLRSSWLVQDGRVGEALADLQTAFAMAPQDIFVRNALGVLLERLGRFDEALPVLEETVRIAPDYVPGQYALGWLYASTGELDKARACFEAAIAVSPDFTDALGQLASLAARRSDWAAARDLAGRALAVDPADAVALTALAGVALAQRDMAACQNYLDRIGNFSRLPPLEMGLAQTVAGDFLDAQGRHGEAFAVYADRNRRKFAQAAFQYDKPGATAADYAHWLQTRFASLPDNGWAAARDIAPVPGQAASHAFLVGFPRSGTTLLENILASHCGICALDERDTLGVAAREFLVDDAGLDRLEKATQEELQHHRQIYWQRVRQFGADVEGKLYVDKYPLSTIKLPLVARLFPDAKILFALRDPRDVLFSCFRRSFSLNSSMFELLDLGRGAKFYATVMELAAQYRRVLGLDWREVRYESLVSDFEGEMKQVCEFLGVPWDAQMHDFAQLSRQRTIKTPSSTQVVRGLYREGRGQWENYAAQLAPALPILAPWIDRYGYAQEPAAP
jgi:tetratricopeptide (TPR) repeat protein